MKRIKFACIEKTMHFLLKEDLPHEAAVAAVRGEVAHYKDTLERSRTQYRIEEETVEPDGSVFIKIKMQYNNIPCGDYLN